MAKKKQDDTEKVSRELDRLSEAVIAAWESGTDEEIATAEKTYADYARENAEKSGLVEQVTEDV